MFSQNTLPMMVQDQVSALKPDLTLNISPALWIMKEDNPLTLKAKKGICYFFIPSLNLMEANFNLNDAKI